VLEELQQIHRVSNLWEVVPPDVPAALEQLVGKLLAKSPADRPINADAVRAALIDIHGKLPAETRTARPFSVPPSTAPPTRSGPQSGGAPAHIGTPTSVDSGDPRWTPPAQNPAPYGAPYGSPPYVGTPPYRPQPYGAPPGGGPYWPGGAVPVYPVALPPAPTPVVIGAWLLRASGLLAITLAVINAITYSQVQTAWHTAYNGLVPASSDNVSGTLVVYFVLAAAQVVFSLLLARGVMRGQYAARVVAICFIALVDIGCCVAGALPVQLNQPGDTDFHGASQLAVDGANNAFAHLFPSSLTIGSAVISILGALMLMTSLILILTPSSSAFFRAWRGQVRVGTPIRIPNM